MVILEHGEELKTCFLNVDLDIYCKADLAPLVSALGSKVCVLHSGRYGRTYCAHLEVAKLTRTVDATIRAFCALIEALPQAERELWDLAKRRDFDIGIQAANEPLCSEFAVSADTVGAVARIGARIVISVYAPEPRLRPPDH